jgi:crossover junction endodeoxyribonuclease RuvC
MTASPAANRCIRVLGVDPAAAGPTGYGVVESDGRRSTMLHYGAFRVATKRQKECSGAALQDVHELLCRLIGEFSPTVMAVESVFTALNMRTALRLAEVRGVVLLAAAQHGVTVHSYSPREVKASEQARERFGLPDPKVLVKSRSLRGGSRTASGQRGQRGHETPVSVAGI